MGFRFRKSIRIVPGVRVNVGKRGVSGVSLGGRGVTTSIGRRGVRQTVGLPGSGLSYSRRVSSPAGCCGWSVPALLALVALARVAPWRAGEWRRGGRRLRQCRMACTRRGGAPRAWQ